MNALVKSSIRDAGSVIRRYIVQYVSSQNSLLTIYVFLKKVKGVY